MKQSLLFVAGLAVIISAVAVSAQAAIGIEPTDRTSPIVTIYATPAEIDAGSSATLTWFTRNATSCYGTDAWSGSKARNGTKVVVPTETATYGLTCRGRGGTESASVVVVVRNVTPPDEPLPPEPPIVEPPITQAPTCTLTSSKSSVLVNETFTISWTTTNADYIGDVGGKNNTNGSISTSVPNAGPYTYAITAYGAGGSTSCSTTISVTDVAPPPPPPSCPTYSIPQCGANSFVTTGPSDSNGCLGAPRCTQGVVKSAPTVLSIAGGTRVSAGSEYGGSGLAGSSGYKITPTNTASATVATVLVPLDTKKVWRLSGKIGLSPISTGTVTPPPSGGGGSGSGTNEGNIQGATYGGSVRVTITALANKIDVTDSASEILFDQTVTPQSGVIALDVPLGIWGMRPNLKLEVSVKKTTLDNQQYGVVVDGLSVYSFGNRPEMSMVRNDIMWAPQSSWDLIIAALAKFPVTHLHESIRTTGSSWFQAPLLKRVQDQGKKITLVIGPLTEDLADGKSVINTPLCAWPTFKHSEMSLEKYEKRLRANLDQYKKSGVNVVSVEVGNELDLYCFGSADIPTDRTPNDADYKLFAETFVPFLEKTVSVVKRPEYYPNAKIILGAPAIDWSPATGKLDPIRMFSQLNNYNGKNYFNLFDGIGIHLYPSVGGEKDSVARAKSYLFGIGQSARPVWVTEWGYRSSYYSGTNPSQQRYESFRAFYGAMLGISEFRVEHLAHYMLDDFNLTYSVVGGDYNLLNEARFFEQYRTPATISASANEIENALACAGCNVTDWLGEAYASVRDFILTLIGN